MGNYKNSNLSIKRLQNKLFPLHFMTNIMALVHLLPVFFIVNFSVYLYTSTNITLHTLIVIHKHVTVPGITSLHVSQFFGSNSHYYQMLFEQQFPHLGNVTGSS